MSHKSVRLLPAAVDLAAMQDTLPREGWAPLLPAVGGETHELPSRAAPSTPSPLPAAPGWCHQPAFPSLLPVLRQHFQ